MNTLTSLSIKRSHVLFLLPFCCLLILPNYADLPSALISLIPDQVQQKDQVSGQTVAGTIKGNYHVDHNGAANYTLPIEVPTGRKGMQPHISLVYNSHHGNGILGKGFKLNGLSVISRVPATEELDGYRGAVNLDANDRFSIDGERLIAVYSAGFGTEYTTTAQQNAAYGNNGTVYFTHHQSWSKIVSMYSQGRRESLGPDQFLVTTKEGIKMTYQGPSLMLRYKNRINKAWYLTRVEDLHGNYYTIDYQPDGTTGEILPATVNYTGHGRRTRPTHMVNFAYEPRPDISIHYQGGRMTKSTKRLQAISTHVSGQLVHTYTFAYQQSKLNTRSLLTSITLSDAAGNSMDPTKFTWDNPADLAQSGEAFVMKRASDFEKSMNKNGLNTLWYQVAQEEQDADDESLMFSATQGRLADMNGDGLPDFVSGYSDYTTRQYLGTFLNHGKGFQKSYNVPNYINWIGKYHWEWSMSGLDIGIYETTEGMLTDLNGDGLMDFVWNGGEGNQMNFGTYLNQGDKFEKVPYFFKDSQERYMLLYYMKMYGNKDHSGSRPDSYNTLTEAFLQDMNGDGLPDYVEAQAPGSIYLNKGKGFMDGKGFETTPAFALGSAPLSTSETKGSLGIEPRHFDYPQSYNRTNLILKDMNGDGLTDMVVNARTAYVLNHGDGFDKDSIQLPGPVNGVFTNDLGESYDIPYAVLIDINGDHLTDYVTGSGDVFLNSGKGFQKASFTLPNTIGNSPINSLFIAEDGSKGNKYLKHNGLLTDLNGDGLPDYIRIVNRNAEVAFNHGNGFGSLKEFGMGSDEFYLNLNKSSLQTGTLADLNGDGITDLLYSIGSAEGSTLSYEGSEGWSPEAYLGSAPRHVITHIEDGIGKRIKVVYKPMTDISVYTKTPLGTDKDSYDTYPYKNIQDSRLLVAHDTTRWDKDPTHFHSKTYHYYEGKVLQKGPGRGWLGFKRMDETNDQRFTTQSTAFSQTYPFTGHILSKSSSYYDFESHGMESSFYAYGDNSKYHNVIEVVSTHQKTDHYTGGRKAFTSAVGSTYDAFGNVTMHADTADVSTTDEITYTHYSYSGQTMNTWQFGVWDSMKVTKGPHCQFKTWDKDNDLSWAHRVYDTNPAGFRTALSAKKKWSDEHHRWVGSSFQHDLFGNVTHTTDPMGSVATIQYDKVYNTFILKKISPAPKADAAALTTTFSYDPKTGALLSQTDANGSQYTYHIDGFGRTTAMYGPNLSGGPSVKLVSYELQNNKKTTMDIFTTNLGTIFTKKEPIWEGDKHYNTASGNTDQANWRTTTEYRDALGRLYKTVVSSPEGKSIIKEKKYNAAGQLLKESLAYYEGDPIHWTVYQYNGEGQVQDITINPGGKDEKRTHITHHPGTKRLTRTVAYKTKHAASTTITLNSKGKIVKRVDPDHGITTYHYDLLGRPDTLTDPLGVKNITAYNSLGLKIKVENNDIGLTTFTHYPNGLLHQKRDAKHQTTTYQYDLLGRLSNKQTAGAQGGKKVVYTYDQNNYPTAGNKGHLTKVTVQNSLTNDPICTYQYAYDLYGHPIASEITLPEGTFAKYASYTENGQFTGSVLPDGTNIYPTYWKDGNLKTIEGFATSGGDTTVFASVTYQRYTAMGQPDSMVYKNNVTEGLDYSEEGLLREHTIYNQGDGTYLPKAYLDQSYAWNAVYDIDTITDNLHAKFDQVFMYDEVSRLKVAMGVYGTKSYSYDLGGNITSKNGNHYTYPTGAHVSHRLQNAGSNRFTYDNCGNTLTKTSPYVIREYVYDEENLLVETYQKIPTTQHILLKNEFTYDHTGRLIREKQGKDTTTLHISDQFKVLIKGNQKTYLSYLTGPDGHEASIARPGSTSLEPAVLKGGIGGFFTPPAPHSPHYDFWITLHDPQFVRSFYQGMMLVITLLCLLLAYGVVICWRRRKYSFRRGWVAYMTPPVLAALVFLSLSWPNTSLVGAPVPSNALQATVYYYHHDQIHSVSMITDASGDIAYQAHYTPYGELYTVPVFGDEDTAPANPDHLEPEFAGIAYNESAKLYHFGARFYDPQLGRFISADSQVGTDPFSPHAFNRYAYSGNNPVDDFDPSGHFLISLIVGALIGAAISAALNATFQAFTGAHWSWLSFGIAAATGALGGAVGAEAGSLASSVLSRAFLMIASRGISAGAAQALNIGFGVIQGVVGATSGQAAANGLAQNVFHQKVNWGMTMGIAAVVGGIFGAAGAGKSGIKQKAYQFKGKVWKGPKGFSKASIGSSGQVKIETTAIKSASDSKAYLKSLLLGYGKSAPSIKKTLFPNSFLSTGAATVKDFFDDDSKLKGNADIFNAFSAHGHSIPGYNGQANGIYQGHATDGKTLLDWSKSRHGIIWQWLHHHGKHKHHH